VSEESPKQGLKVTDKRRFDVDGQERSAAEKAEQVKERQGSESKVVSVDAASNAGAESKHSAADDKLLEITFSSFVVSFATQALMQLGKIKAPEGVSVPLDRVGAKQTIDILSMLETKTKGNLDADEKRLMEEILHRLRMAFVNG